MAKDVNSTVWSSEIAESLLIAIKTFPQVLIVIIISLFVLVPRRRTSSTGKSKVIKPYAIRVECIPLGYPHENLQNELENIVNGDLDLKNGVKRILHHFLSQKDQRFACATATFFTSLSPDELTRKLTNGSTRLSLGYCFDVDFFGITPLYDSFQVDDIDVIAVPGLSSHAIGSWKSPSNQDVWIRDYLPQDVQGIRVLLYGYSSALCGSDCKDSIENLGKSFLESLKAFRRDTNTDHRPIVFIGHSLGGLLIKEAIVHAHNRSDEAQNDYIRRSCYGLLLFGVPHLGLRHEQLINIVHGRPNESLVRDLIVDHDSEPSSFLKRISDDFSKYCIGQYQYRIVSFFERGLSNTVQIGLNGKPAKTGSKLLLVTERSATSTGLTTIAKENNIPLPMDHSGLVKFHSRSQNEYSIVKSTVQTFTLGAREQIGKHFKKDGMLSIKSGVTSTISANFLQGLYRTMRLAENYRELAQISSTSASSYPCHIIPYPRNARFQGRHQMLREMGKILLPDAQGLPRSLALTGIGGVGKSQTALEFVYCNKTAFDAILWASADTIVKLNQAYASFGLALGLQSASRGGDCVREDIKKWMCNTDYTWLLILDNIDDSELVNPYLPSTDRGSILMTTRSRSPYFTTAARSQVVEPLSLESTATLLKKQLALNSHVQLEESPTVDKSAYDISKELGGLPLAVIQVVGFIVNASLGLPEVADMLKNTTDSKALLQNHKGPVDPYYPLNMSNVWDVTFSNLGQTTTDFLAIVAFLDPDSIPEQLFEGHFDICSQMPELDFLKSRAEFLKVLGVVKVQSFIERYPEKKTFSVHRLVTARVIYGLDEDDTCWNRSFDLALRLLFEKFPRQKMGMPLHQFHQACDLYLPHVQKLALHYKKMYGSRQMRKRLVDLLHNATWYMFERAWFSDILPYTSIALQILNDIDEGQSLDAGLILNTIGSYYMETFNPTAAVHYLEKVLHIRQKCLPPGDPVISNIMHNLALAYGSLGDYKRSKEMCEAAIAIREHLPVTEHNLWFQGQCLPKNYTTHCRILFFSGSLEEAEIVGRRAVDKARDSLGEKHQNTAQAYCTLAEVLSTMGKMDEALEYHEAALKIRIELLGSHYQTAASYYKLGLIYRPFSLVASRDFFATAEGMYRKIYKSNGPLARVLYQLSSIYAGLGESKASSNSGDEAIKLLYEATGETAEQAMVSIETYDKLVGFMER